MKYSVLYIFLLFACACAVVKSPQGGPKDTAAPLLTGQFPVNGTTGFSNNQIYFTFNEYIKVNNFINEASINPYIDPSKIEVKVSGKKLILILPDSLPSNTTFNINLGNSVVDITEGNPIKDLSINFSNGSAINENKLIGKIYTFEGIEEKQKTFIGLYKPNTNPINDKPVYYTRTDSSKFTLQNLDDNKYEVYAFTDKNNNMLYDSLSESIAFLNQIIDTKTTDSLNLFTFKEEVRKFTFSRPAYKDKFVDIEFTKGLKTISCKQPYLYDATKRKLFIYETGTNLYDLNFKVTDSLNNKIDTTISLIKSSAKMTDSSLKIIQVREYTNTIPFQGIQLNFNHKVKSINKDSILIVINKDTLMANSSKVSINLNTETNIVDIKPTKPSDTLKVILKDYAFNSYSGHYNKKQVNIYIPTSDKEYGTITGTITTDHTNYVMYLYNKSNKLVYTLNNPKSINLKYLPADTYFIKVLIDKNNNNVFDTGDLQSKTQPEQIYLYEKPLDVKNNWELGNINISF